MSCVSDRRNHAGYPDTYAVPNAAVRFSGWSGGFFGKAQKSRLLARSRLSFKKQVKHRLQSYGLVFKKLSELIIDLFEQLSKSTFTKYRELLTQAVKVQPLGANLEHRCKRTDDGSSE